MHKINIVKLFFLTFILSLFVACASTSTETVPQWILSPSTVYSDSEYLSAVGYGSDRQSAENAAIAAITKIIKQNVQTETTSNESFSTLDGNWNIDKGISSTTKTYSDVEISGVYIQDVYPVKKGKTVEYYALALVNRKETGTMYKSKIQELSAVINQQITEGYKKMGTFDSYSLLKNATELAIECDYYLDILGVINPDFYKVSQPDYGNAENCAELARRSLAKVVIGFDVKGDIDGRVSSAFAKIFTNYGIKLADSTDEEATYIFQADVSFSPMTMSGESKNKFIRFVLNSNLIEVASQKNILAFALSGREAHLSEEEATQRAVRTLEQEIKSNFQAKFDSLF